MNEFVEECRREWKRLQVPDPVANEMAADLEADLREAEAEGGTPEDVLGTGAFDPRSFAASWAIERGVTGTSEPAAERRPVPVRSRWRTGVLVGLAGVGLAAIVAVMGVALAMHPFGSAAQAAIASPGRGPVFLPPSAPSVRLLEQAHGHDLRDAIAGVGLVLVFGVGAAAALVMLYFSPLAGSGVRPGRRRHPGETPDAC